MKVVRLILLLWCACAVAQAGNLLLNPGFEEWMDDSTPAGWQVESRARTGVFAEPETVWLGASSARLVRRTLAAGNNYGLVQRVPVKPGTWHRVDLHYFDDNPEVSVGVGASWRRADTSYIGASAIRYSSDSSDWQAISDSFLSPGEAAFADFRIRTYAPSGMSAERRVLVDAARFGPPEPVPETLRIWFAQDSLGLRLVDFFDGAQSSIDYCCYNSSRADVTSALLEAHARGVRVRVVTDNARLGNPWVQALRAAGIAVWTDSIGPRAGDYMHNKFAVVDLEDADTLNDRAWVASYNANEGDLKADFAMEIPHSALARAYRAEFNQMWGSAGPVPVPESAKFHTGKRDVLETHEFLLDGHPAHLYFSPQDRPVDTIAARVRAAQQHVAFAVYAYTYNGLGDAMIERWLDSVWVGGVIDRSGIFGTGSQYPRLISYGIPVYEDSVAFGEKMVHEKIMVIDSTVTVAGSANWSVNGNQNNDENVLIMQSPRIARRFLEELYARFWEATNPGVAEELARAVPPRRTVSPVRGIARLESSQRLYDATGRQVSAGNALAPGVYYVVDEDTKLRSRVVVVR